VRLSLSFALRATDAPGRQIGQKRNIYLFLVVVVVVVGRSSATSTDDRKTTGVSQIACDTEKHIRLNRNRVNTVPARTVVEPGRQNARGTVNRSRDSRLRAGHTSKSRSCIFVSFSSARGETTGPAGVNASPADIRVHEIQ